MKVTYYINGSQVSGSTALDCLSNEADRMGYESENWSSAWDRRATSEEAREFLNEISGYTVEIMVQA